MQNVQRKMERTCEENPKQKVSKQVLNDALICKRLWEDRGLDCEAGINRNA